MDEERSTLEQFQLWVEECVRTQQEDAFLHFGPLTAVPEEIARCTSLKNLAVRGEHLSGIAALGQLTGLRELDCSECRSLRDLAPLAALTRLETLSLHSCEEIASLQPLESLPFLRELDVSYCRVGDDFTVSKLTSLRKLGSAGQRELGHIKGLAALTNLEELDLSSARFLSDFQPLAGLTKLRVLNLNGCYQLRDLDALANLTSLEELILTHCFGLVDVRGLANLTRLKRLEMQHPDTIDYDVLAKLTDLETLQVPGTGQTHLDALAGMKRLTTLSAGGKNVTDLRALAGLTNLKCLFLTTAPDPTDLAPLGRLSKLETLHLSTANLRSLNALAPLKNLQNLSVRMCRQLTDISAVADMHALEDLDLHGCSELADLHPLAYLPELGVLNLSDCKALRDLSAVRPLLPQLGGLNLSRCQLDDVPPSLCDDVSGPDVDAHFTALEQQGAASHRECKVLLLGNGRAGKSQLARHLRRLPFEERWDSTHGIHFWGVSRSLAVEGEAMPQPVRLNLWDFGGQDLYHHTHRVFFQAGAIYLVLWDAFEPADGVPLSPAAGEAATDRPHSLVYWLDQVFSLGTKGGQPPRVLIVRNKADADAGRAVPDWRDLVPQPYRTAVDYVEISLRDKAAHAPGLAALDAWIARAVARELGPPARARIGRGRLATIQELRLRQTEVTRTLERARRANETARPERDCTWLTRGEFDELARLCIADALDGADPASVDDYQDTSALLGSLDLMGIVRYKARRLGDRVIIDQRWAAEGIYTLFRREDCYRRLLARDGVFTFSDVKEWAWEAAGYTDEEQRVFFQFMLDCRIAFQLLFAEEAAAGEAVYVAPSCLPALDDPAAPRPQLARRVRDVLAAGGPGQFVVSAENRYLSESAMQELLHRLGILYGRSAVLWRWGAAFQAASRHDEAEPWEGAARIEWRASAEGSYGGRLTVGVHAPDPAAAHALFRRIREEVGQLPGFPKLPAEAWQTQAPPGEAADEPVLAAELRELLREKTDRPDPGTGGLSAAAERRTGRCVSISYAGEAESAEVVRKLSAALTQLGRQGDARERYTVIDYAAEHSFGRVSQLIRQLAKGDIVLIFLSEKYFRSPYCMTELVLVYELPPPGEFPPEEVWVYAFPGARQFSEDWERFWREERRKFNEEIGRDARGEYDRSEEILQTKAYAAWFKFIARAENSLHVLRNRLRDHITQAATPPDSAELDGWVTQSAGRIDAQMRRTLPPPGTFDLIRQEARREYLKEDYGRAKMLYLRAHRLRPGYDPAAEDEWLRTQHEADPVFDAIRAMCAINAAGK